MQDFPSNSQQTRATEPRERIEPVTSADVRRNKGLGRRFKDTFIGGSPRDALWFMAEDVVIPAVRDTLYNAMQSGLDRLIYGEGPSRPRRSSGLGSGSRVDYSTISTSTTQRPRSSGPRTISRASRARHDFRELIIPSAQEANEVIDRMYDILSRDGMVSVADLFELTGIQSAHTDQKWGWTNLRGARAIRQGRGGFILSLPKTEELG